MATTLSSHLEELQQSVVSSTKASISVLLILVYGYYLRRHGWITGDGESNISKIGTTFLLPALLFSEIGPLATAEKLVNYWPIIPFSLLTQLVSLIVGELSHYFGMPQHFVPLFIFNNVTSLPLLLLHALSRTGSLDALVRPGEDLAEVLSRGKVYILINALVGNLTRFGLGPYLMRTHRDILFLHPHNEDPRHDPEPKSNKPGTSSQPIALPTDTPADPELRDCGTTKRYRRKVMDAFKLVYHYASVVLNPPLVAGILAICFGLIPWTHYQFFNTSGWLTPLADSIKNMGDLYTVLQTFILGAHLYAQRGHDHAPTWIAIWLFTYRFFLAPLLAISTVYGIRTIWPTLITPDPILDFVLSISSCGPPALTLSAVAQMANLPTAAEGQISKMLTISYIVTPLVALSITAALDVVEHSGAGK